MRKKTVETCAVRKKQQYYYGDRRQFNGRCLGYEKERGEGLLKACEKCEFLFKEVIVEPQESGRDHQLKKSINKIRKIVDEWKSITWKDNFSYDCMVKIAELIKQQESEDKE